MPKFDVHLYAIVIVKVENVEAENEAEAVKQAEFNLDMDAALRNPGNLDLEFADDFEDYALVDVCGDQDFENSKWMTFDRQTESWRIDDRKVKP